MKRWKSCFGYVIICIMGKYPEKTVSRLASSGIRLENVIRIDEGVKARMRAEDLIAARPLFRGSGCRVRIEKKRGIPRIAMRLRASAIFLTALIALSLTAALLSTRVWFIEAETLTIPIERVMRTLREQGVFPGCRRSAVDNTALSKALCASSDVVNAKISLKGVTLKVAVAEASGRAQIGSEEAVFGVYADRDGIISSVSVTSGRALVKKGQAVKEGDLLITGDMSGLKEGFVVPAAGEIEAEVLRVFSATAEAERVTLRRTGVCASLSSVSVFGIELMPPLPFAHCELEPKAVRIISGCPIPVEVREYSCMELCERVVLDSPEGTEYRAGLAAQEKLMRGVPKDASIISVKRESTENPDGSVTVVLYAVTSEKIGIGK